MDAIEIDRLTKRYGAARGVEDVSLRVPEGEIFGFIGPNGAGKTTTIRAALGLLRPTAGRIALLGRDVATAGPAARLGVGYVPGEVSLDDAARVRDLLGYLGGFHPGDHRARRDEVAAALGLDLDAAGADLSLGNRKKVAIVAALQHRPALVILDEPTSGLDPVVQATLFELLEAEAARGATIFLSSHVLSEVQRLCRQVAVINEGRLVAVEDVAGLRARQVRRVAAVFGAAGPPDALAALPGVEAWERDDGGVRFVYRGPAPALLAALAQAAPDDVRIEEPSLEEIVMHHYLAPRRRGGRDVDAA
ncbi:MAG: ABC transporter ATP-binding protein [Kofleriaceae bacterium]|nr:ABC transporter ATP-binding protein [Myxococcales bacterium]MCB9575245.1 ABC transporter ATP-binding protein [Kofleriaceae bacterium]